MSELVSKLSLWTWETERDILTETMFATIYCDPGKGGCGYTEKAVFRNYSGKCVACGEKAIVVYELNQRNAVVADATELFALGLFRYAVNTSSALSGKFFVKRGIISRRLELQRAASAELAILNRNIDGPVEPETIELIIVLKMSIIWNWVEANRSYPIADYDVHARRPSIYRTDNILKAIGRAAIIRSCPDSERIPFIVVGNTPPPPSYRDKVDGIVRVGLIQKWLSLTHDPLVVEPDKFPSKRNPKQTPGFLRIDNIKELQGLLTKILTTKRKYVGAVVEPRKAEALIKSLGLPRSPKEIGNEFLRRIS